VLTLAGARLVVNVAQVTYESDEDYSVRGPFQGWTLAELAVLNRYRRQRLGAA